MFLLLILSWLFLQVAFPILPLGVIAYLTPGKLDMFNGTEFYLLTVAMSATTMFDLYQFRQGKKRKKYKYAFRVTDKTIYLFWMLLPSTALILGIVYVHYNLQALDIDEIRMTLLAKVLFGATLVFCLFHQGMFIRESAK